MTTGMVVEEQNSREAALKERDVLERYPYSTVDSASMIQADRLKIVGGASSGKTETLIKRIASLINNGMAPNKICVVVNTEGAKQSFGSRLSAATDKAAEVTITTAAEICFNVLNTEEARQVTGRTPRLLNKAEYTFVLEDLKISGLKPGRLKKMLNYFYYQWSQLEPEDEWLLPREEAGVREWLDNALKTRNAMIREELVPLYVSYLQDLREEGESAPYSAVLVDDYQNLSRASQVLCDLLCEGSLTVTGNENQFMECEDLYPYQQGFTAFEKAYVNAVCIQLEHNRGVPTRIAKAGNALCMQGDMSDNRLVSIEEADNDSSITRIKWTFPADELSGIVQYVESLIANKKAVHEDIFIVAPNNAWAKSLQSGLNARNIPVEASLSGQPLSGDPRDLDRSKNLIAYTKLNLLADPHDVVAWRSWCGFGNYLCNSGAWSRLETWAKDHNTSVVEALEAISNESRSDTDATSSEEVFLEAKALIKKYREGRTFIENNQGKTGFLLTKSFGEQSDIPAFFELIKPLIGDETAEELYVRASKRILTHSFSRKDTVRVGTCIDLQGSSSPIVIMSGLVDGFMPTRDGLDAALLEEDREKTINKERRVFYSTIVKAKRQLVLSTIQKVDLETAERLKLVVRRVKMENGRRLAMLSPSLYIDETGDAIPGAVSGEQFLHS